MPLQFAPVPRTPLAGMLGALLGDALGVPHEFKRPEELPRLEQIEMIMPAGYLKTYPDVPYGTWSDDGSQLLCVLESLYEDHGRLNLEDLAWLLVLWKDKAHHQAGGRVFDCGLQTLRSLDRIRAGGTATVPGFAEKRSNGNGSLMRSLPFAFTSIVWRRAVVEVIPNAMVQSSITHAHSISRMTCALYVETARLLLDGADSTDWDALVSIAANNIKAHFVMRDRPALLDSLQEILTYPATSFPRGTGYVVDSFWSAIAALKASHNLSTAIQHAVAMGNDTDTTATVTGGLAGIAYGFDPKAAEWLSHLVMPENSAELLRKLA